MSTGQQEIDLHDRLLADLTQWFRERGNFVETLAYHERLTTEIQNRLAGKYDMGSLSVRLKSDTIVVPPNAPSFKLEVKSNAGGWRNLVFEALQFLFHMDEHLRGIKCLYFYRDLRLRRNAAFYATPGIFKVTDSLYIPKTHSSVSTILVDWTHQYCSAITIISPPIVNGSGDPYYRILENKIPWLKNGLEHFLEDIS